MNDLYSQEPYFYKDHEVTNITMNPCIKTKCVESYCKNGVQYIHYIGECFIDGKKYEIDIPKMELLIRGLSLHKYDYWLGQTSYGFADSDIILQETNGFLFTLKQTDEGDK